MHASGRPGSAVRDAAATEPAHLLRFTPTGRPYPGFRKNRRPSTCGFIFAQDGMVGGCRPNVVDGPVSWRAPRRAVGGIAAAESFSEIVLASAFEFPYSTSSHGGVAQLGERLTGSQEVRGSIPLVSTTCTLQPLGNQGLFCYTGSWRNG